MPLREGSSIPGVLEPSGFDDGSVAIREIVTAGTLPIVWGAVIEAFSAEVKLLDLGIPRPLEPDEVLVDVRAAGVGNWDEIARGGGWDLGRRPPMALGVEAAGVVSSVGRSAGEFTSGDRVLARSAPFRSQGAWAQQFIVPAAAVAVLPAGVPFEEAGSFPVPALTADQALHDGISISKGETVLVNGAGGVTGNLLVQLAALSGANVIATAGPGSTERAKEAGAALVVDSSSPKWATEVRSLTRGNGVDGAVNAVPGQASTVLGVVRDNGRLATITSDPPASVRGVQVRQIYVPPDGGRLHRLTAELASGAVNINVTAVYPLDAAAEALAHVRRGSAGGTVVLRVNRGSPG
jgi:NADPH:quinone reductase-like Zn-dependent oxidoreductase